ncbi:unnamed protein product [Acanthosepion pharaonis]|uniref:Uncharacterized protein n=1 Tax=Acanthosepion pharaonis TaxID=158019 RepID=A0A812CMA1_ACAPH|nr:unnamed protein product [Sepia pharaonis]
MSQCVQSPLPPFLKQSRICLLVEKGHDPSSSCLLYEPSYLDARDFTAAFSRLRKQPGRRAGLRPWQSLGQGSLPESRFCAQSSRPSPAAGGTQHQQHHLFKQSFSGLTSESHSIATLRGSTHFTLCYCFPSEMPDNSCSFLHSCSYQQYPAHSCSFQLTPASSSTPAASSSLLQHSCSSQLTPAASSTPAAPSSLLQLPAHSSSYQLTPAASHTTSSNLRIPFPNKRPLSSFYPPFANKDTISIAYNGPSAFVILLCYCLCVPFLVVRSIGTHTSRPAATPTDFSLTLYVSL